MKFVRPIFLSGLALASSNLFAAEKDFVGTLTEADGTVQVFEVPTKGKSKSIDETWIRHGGESFLVREAKVGQPIENGSILRTAAGAHARVVFPNGDLFQVGSGSAYSASWAKSHELRVRVLYGKFRGVVVKEGPRRKMLLRSKAAVMGVRGTDFFVTENALTGESDFSVIRGTVAVTPVLPDESDFLYADRVVEVTAGKIATVVPVPVSHTAGTLGASPTPVPSSNAASEEMRFKKGPKAEVEGLPKIEVRAIAQSELKDISSQSSVASAAPKDPEVAKKVAELEKNALAATVEEVKKAGGSLAKAPKTLEEVHAASVEALLASAPPTATKAKKSDAAEAEDEDAMFKKVFQK